MLVISLRTSVPTDNPGSMYELIAEHHPDISQLDFSRLYVTWSIGHRISPKVQVSHPPPSLPSQCRCHLSGGSASDRKQEQREFSIRNCWNRCWKMQKAHRK